MSVKKGQTMTTFSLWLLLCLSTTAALAAPEKPNILLIIADDMGYSDLGITGSEIKTPTLDQLARSGVIMDNFHVADTCSPTRSMLLTGIDNHRNGLGSMGEFLTAEQRGQPGYEGALNRRVETIAETLGSEGYLTYAVGKWHLGLEPEQDPHARGFKRTFVSLEGAGDNWSATGASPNMPHMTFTKNGKKVQRPPGFSSHLYTDQLIAQIDADSHQQQPFFAYLSYQAVHWPHHAPKDKIQPYRKLYQSGWDELRKKRFEQLQHLGVVDAGLSLRPRDPRTPAWNSLDTEQRIREAMRMAVYAGMLEDMDEQISRLLSYLSKHQKLDNTLIVFLSDNGPDWSEPNHTEFAKDWYDQRYPDRSVENMGGPGTFPTRGRQWAQLSAAHLRSYKGSSGEGGVRVPLIVNWPAKIPGGIRSNQFSFVTDVVPTLLAAANVKHPANATGNQLHSPDGDNLLPMLLDSKVKIRADDKAVAYELMKDAAIYQGEYKLVRMGAPFGDNQWKLFDIVNDPSELVNLSAKEKKITAVMKAKFEQYMKDYGVIPTPQNFSVVNILLGQDPNKPAETKH